MIIKRLAEGIRNQDWFVVAVEIMIVVVGIFVGLQVDDWNKDRQNKKEEGLYLERLYSDLNSSIHQIEGDLGRLREWRTNGERTLYALIENKPEDVGGNGAELVRATRINLSAPRLATINELVMGGRLNIIGDPEIRKAIAEYDAEIKGLWDLNSILLEYIGSVSNDLSKHISPVKGYSLNSLAHYDFDALSGDIIFQNQLAYALRLQLANEGWHQRMLEITAALRDRIQPLVANSQAPS